MLLLPGKGTRREGGRGQRRKWPMSAMSELGGEKWNDMRVDEAQHLLQSQRVARQSSAYLLLLDFNLCAQRLLPSCKPRDPP